MSTTVWPVQSIDGSDLTVAPYRHTSWIECLSDGYPTCGQLRHRLKRSPRLYQQEEIAALRSAQKSPNIGPPHCAAISSGEQAFEAGKLPAPNALVRRTNRWTFRLFVNVHLPPYGGKNGLGPHHREKRV